MRWPAERGSATRSGLNATGALEIPNDFEVFERYGSQSRAPLQLRNTPISLCAFSI